MLRAFLLAGISCAFLASAAPVRAADADIKAIINDAIKAQGGEELLEKLKAGHSKNKGKLTLPMVGEVDFKQDMQYMLPNKLLDSLTLNVMGQEVGIVTTVNGDKISLEVNGNVVPVTEEVKAALKDAQHLVKVARLTSLLKDKTLELSSVGEIKVNDKPAIAIRVASKGHKDVTLAFDKQSHLMVKIEHRTLESGSGMEVNEERVITEFTKNKAGLQVPKKISIYHDGKKFGEIESEESELLESIDDGVFKVKGD
ncbi:hypothetical protein KIH39_18895 [Telmatocola sphagniphila]|uniref:Uncharacterized protein n=1 Tax=Telmatocola sphagniphila TaxID=1123043 RepID=A0A8E6ESL0_9BACT|nr:hypothetical protein [Telmatocola sphagniphila]QVL30904.1 hypothetical protein KIH39_18895 [Telmatocola sphagniphila]